jgi:DNA-binding SARP family transcriptional activator
MGEGPERTDRPPMIALSLLGGFELRLHGEVRGLAPACQHLLALLALSRNGQTRGRLAGTMWPDSDERRAGANLRGVIWRLPTEVRAGLVTSGPLVKLGSQWDVDLERVHDLARRFATEPDEVATAVDAFYPDLLPGWYDEWLVSEQERHRNFRLNMLEALAQHHLDCGAPGLAADLGLAVVGVEPLRESAQHLLIRAYLEQGNRAMASRQFARFRDELRLELGVEPDPELRALLEPLTETAS